MRFLSLRALFLLGFVIAMPVLALPPVARRIDELLYGPPPADFGRAPAAAPLSEELMQPRAAGAVSSVVLDEQDGRDRGSHNAHAGAPSRFDEPSPASSALPGSRAESRSVPELSPTPQFSPPS